MKAFTTLGDGDFAALGVRRISVGGALALAAWGGFMRAAQSLKSDGSFAGFVGLAPYADINNFLAADLRTRGM
jgi:2-methylisocitrate lyase-like PEP mutase family enzyme